MSNNNRIVSIVDDELDITELFKDVLLGINGFSVLTFNDSMVALNHFTKNKDDYILIISDLRMPGLNGLVLLKKSKKLNPFVRTILMSAYEIENEEEFLKYMKQGIIDKFIQKPITIGAFRQEVNEQVHSYQLLAKP